MRACLFLPCVSCSSCLSYTSMCLPWGAYDALSCHVLRLVPCPVAAYALVCLASRMCCHGVCLSCRSCMPCVSCVSFHHVVRTCHACRAWPVVRSLLCLAMYFAVFDGLTVRLIVSYVVCYMLRCLMLSCVLSFAVFR